MAKAPFPFQAKGKAGKTAVAAKGKPPFLAGGAGAKAPPAKGKPMMAFKKGGKVKC